MQTIVAIIGLLILAMGVTGIIHPPTILRLARTVWESKNGIYIVVSLRVTFGIILIIAAPDCRFPMTIRVLGIFTLIAAAAVLTLGASRVHKLLDWWSARPPAALRVWLLTPTALGAFFIYAAL